MYRVPVVRDKDTVSDIYSRLLKDRIVLLTGTVDDDMSEIVIAQMLYLHSVDKESGIRLYINSPGGSVDSGLAIYDVMNFIKGHQKNECPIETYCVGKAASMGAVLLSNGTKGKRYSLEHSRIMIHQPLSGTQGQVTDIQIHAKESQNIKDKLNNLLSQNTGQKLAKVTKDTERDYFMSPDEAKEYGIIDVVMRRSLK